MNKYLEVAKISFKAQIVYIFDVCIAAVYMVTKILFAYVLWGAVFRENETVAGFTYPAMFTYYIFSSFLSQIELSGNVSEEISSSIRRGTFSKFMVIPAGTQTYFIAQTFGVMLFYLVFILAASVAWTVLFRARFMMTSNPVLILEAIIMIILGLVFMIQLNYFLGILAFKYLDISAFLMIKSNVVAFITGSLVPLSLLPDAVITVMRIFPFYYVTYLPSMLLIGKNTEEALTGIIVLSAWFLLFTVLNKIAYNKLRVIYDGVGI